MEEHECRVSVFYTQHRIEIVKTCRGFFLIAWIQYLFSVDQEFINIITWLERHRKLIHSCPSCVKQLILFFTPIIETSCHQYFFHFLQRFIRKCMQLLRWTWSLNDNGDLIWCTSKSKSDESRTKEIIERLKDDRVLISIMTYLDITICIKFQIIRFCIE